MEPCKGKAAPSRPEGHVDVIPFWVILFVGEARSGQRLSSVQKYGLDKVVSIYHIFVRLYHKRFIPRTLTLDPPAPRTGHRPRLRVAESGEDREDLTRLT